MTLGTEWDNSILDAKMPFILSGIQNLPIGIYLTIGHLVTRQRMPDLSEQFRLASIVIKILGLDFKQDRVLRSERERKGNIFHNGSLSV